MEGLSQALSQKELEIAKMDQLLQHKKKDMEPLQQTIQEKDQQMTELSFSVTEKMVQLNEEKFSLEVELKTLKEQLNSLPSAEEAKEEQAGETHRVVSNRSQDESSPAGLLNELKALQQQYVLRNQEVTELRPLKAQLQEYQEQKKSVQMMKEELRQESLAWQDELHQLSLSEVQQQLCSTKQEASELKKLPEEEQDHRLAAENALSLAEEQIRRLEHSEWDLARTPVIGACGSQEMSVLIDIPGSSCRRNRSDTEWKLVLHSLCHSWTRGPLLATICFLMVHFLLILCFIYKLLTRLQLAELVIPPSLMPEL
ncbi:Golgin subfamily B member 1 [Lemmus lemmus]